MNTVHECTNTFDTTEFYVVWNDVTHSTFISLRILNWCLALFAADEDRFNLDIYQHRLLMRDTRHPFAYWPLSCVEVFGCLQRYSIPESQKTGTNKSFSQENREQRRMANNKNAQPPTVCHNFGGPSGVKRRSGLDTFFPPLCCSTKWNIR